MERLRPVLTIVTVIAILGGIIAFLALRDGTPTQQVEIPGGEAREVTPAGEMRVRTAEGEPEIDMEAYSLKVGGLVDEEVTLSFDQVKSMEAQERYVELPCVEGWTERAVWKGPRVAELLDMAGVDKQATTVVFTSPGGYTTSLTLRDIEEVDPLLAYQVNGKPLPEEQGYPLRLVVPDRLGYKWIKWVDGLELIAGEYEGYWESRGYSNEAKVP